jgi:hypothetical protein
MHNKQESPICFEPEKIHVSALPMHNKQQTVKKIAHPFSIHA